MSSKLVAKRIFLAGVERVLPDRLINKAISIRDNHMIIDSFNLSLDSFKDIYVIGAGKASALMGAEVERILGERITGGHIIVKYGHSCHLNKIKVTEAGHPVPDSKGFAATRAILELARNANVNDLVICLLSGGGSALLADFPEGLSPDDIMIVNKLLVKSGATINEINTVRKHLSQVKGGQLAKSVFPGTMVSLILSDVIGDPLDVIASGPTVPDPTTFNEALYILEKYDISRSLRGGIIYFLNEGVEGKRPETPKPDDPVFERTFNLLVGSNRLALEAASEKALEFGMQAIVITDRIAGNIDEVSSLIVESALDRQRDKGLKKPVCLLFGGEPTVRVSGDGTGGRNQHLALNCSFLLREHQGITVLSAGTDGSDGPTTAAGAVVDCNTYNEAVARGIIPEDFLSRFDSFNFFRKTGGHIITGPTRTNVMDIVVVIVE